MFFAPSTEQADLSTAVHTVRSMWFQAGSFYTLNGTDTIKLKGGTSTGHVLVVTNDASAPRQSETNIESDVQLESINTRAHIENWSEGGLRLGGLFKADDFNVQFGGTGAIHLAGRIVNNSGNRGNPNFYIQGSAGTQENVHVILSGNNDQSFGGILRVEDRGFLIVKHDQALGEGSNKRVNEGGTLALRSHLETPLTYAQPQQNNFLEIFGVGIVRIAGTTKRIGGLYNDGGKNSLNMRIQQNTTAPSPAGFGARGDRGGSLELRNQVKLTNEFHKLGPGLIILNNTYSGGDTNQWDKDTHLKAGVLRIANAASLPSASNIVFDGGEFGGILELGYGTTPFTYNLGTGGGNIRWIGDGGFSAYGGARTVNIGSGTALTWASTANFIGDGHALLLSSRYADNVITFTNNINLNGRLREVRVERGEDSAHAVMSGALSGTGSSGLRKTGDGLLRLRGTNTYTGATRIEGGALRGAPANTASNIVLAGGVLGLDGNFTRGLGTGGDKIRWLGSGGFAAYGQNRTVNIGGANATLTWGTGGFIGSGSELRFGHYTANRTVLWDNALELGSGERIIRIERGSNTTLADVEFRQAISGTGTVTGRLHFVGNGRADLTADNSSLLGEAIAIYGAELRLHGNGKIGKIRGVDIRYGGILNLLNTNGSHTDRIADDAGITLAAGTLKLDSAGTAISEKIGDLTLESGANTIKLSRGSASVELHIENFLHQIDDPNGSGKIDSRATLNVSGDLNNSLINFKLSTSAASHEVGGIIPWGTNEDDWLTAVTITQGGNTEHFLRRFAAYDAVTEGNWLTSHNVKTAAIVTLGGGRTLNSLILGGDLDLGSYTLTINSGGLMVTGNRTINGSGTITTGTPSGGTIRPLYIHNAETLTFDGTASLNGGMDVVKTRTGSLILNSSGTHQIGSLYIHQGTVDLRQGTLQIGAGDHRIYIGDGAGTDKLILPGGRWNPITKDGGGLPSITLRGTPYDPRGPEYGGGQAILQLGGDGGSDGKTYGAGTKQRLAELRIEGRGTIDWRGGEVGLANILWVESLSFSSTSDRLFIRNWYEYEDLFLVRRDNFHTDLLPQIIFEGYQDYVTTWKDYDANYIQITPFGQGGYLPEPSTYGAILGAVGVAIWTWRKRRAASDK